MLRSSSKSSHVQYEDAKIPRYRATLVPRESLGLSNHRATPIASVKPYQPNRMLLLGGWQGRSPCLTNQGPFWSLQQVKVGVRRRRHIGTACIATQLCFAYMVHMRQKMTWRGELAALLSD